MSNPNGTNDAKNNKELNIGVPTKEVPVPALTNELLISSTNFEEKKKEIEKKTREAQEKAKKNWKKNGKDYTDRF